VVCRLTAHEGKLQLAHPDALTLAAAAVLLVLTGIGAAWAGLGRSPAVVPAGAPA